MLLWQSVVHLEIEQIDCYELLFALEQLEAFRFFQLFECLIHPIRMAAFVFRFVQPFQRFLALAGFPAVSYTHLDALVKDEEATAAWRDYTRRYCPPGPLLELACGSGEISIALAGAGYTVDATDLSLSLIHI